MVRYAGCLDMYYLWWDMHYLWRGMHYLWWGMLVDLAVDAVFILPALWHCVVCKCCRSYTTLHTYALPCMSCCLLQIFSFFSCFQSFAIFNLQFRWESSVQVGCGYFQSFFLMFLFLYIRLSCTNRQKWYAWREAMMKSQPQKEKCCSWMLRQLSVFWAVSEQFMFPKCVNCVSLFVHCMCWSLLFDLQWIVSA